ncbi:unnamed protein product [Spodoptera exigua]|nr:unnamed protein product [Spodoptera exigua]
MHRLCSRMKSSRARRILGLLAENSTPDCENTITSPDYELEYEKPNNSNMNSNNEVQNEHNIPTETEDKTIAESIEHFEKTNEVAIPKTHFQHLVPYSDSDISLSDHEDTRYTTTEAEN